MKLIIFMVTVITACYAEKLDRTYLPPSGAHSSGGSPGALQAPGLTESFNRPTPPLITNHETQRPAPYGSAPNSATGHSGYSLDDNISTSSGKLPYSALTHTDIIPSMNDFSRITSAGSKYMPIEPVSAYNTPFSNRPIQSYDDPESSRKSDLTPERPQDGQERNSDIIFQHSDITADNFSYAFETQNGIRAEERGIAANGVQAQGGFSYMGDDGIDYSITYTADENGYRPQGKHLPTPPPIPDVILRSLQTIAQAKAAGISYEDDSGSLNQQNSQPNSDPIQKKTAPFQRDSISYQSYNGPNQQNNIPAHQKPLHAPTQQYAEPILGNNMFVDDKTSFFVNSASAVLNDEAYVNNRDVYPTITPNQQSSIFPSPQFVSNTKSEHITSQNTPSAQQKSGPYYYNSPVQHHSQALQSTINTPYHNGAQAQRPNLPNQKYSNQSDDRPVPHIKEQRFSTLTQTINGPRQSGSGSSHNKYSGHQTSPPTQRYSVLTQQYPHDSRSNNGPGNYPTPAQKFNTPTQGYGHSMQSNYRLTESNNAPSHQNEMLAQFSNPTQQFNDNEGNVPIQHYSSPAQQIGASSQSNTGLAQFDNESSYQNRDSAYQTSSKYRSPTEINHPPAQSGNGSHQNKVPVHQTAFLTQRYSKLTPQYDTHSQFANEPAHKEEAKSMAKRIITTHSTRNEFDGTRVPASYSTETGYKY